MKLAIVGATGVTGGFAFLEAEKRGFAPIIVGRESTGLRNLAVSHGLPPDRVRIADAHDANALRQAFGDVTHVISAVAPFSRNGLEIARAAAELGLGYTDSTGEAGFMMRLIGELDSVAVRSGATLCTGNGASAFVGDVATRWLAPIDDPAAEATLLYDIRNYRPTFGTLKSYLTSIIPGGGPVVRGGQVEFRPFGALSGSARGVRGIHGIFPDPIVISRYWAARRIDALMRGNTSIRPMIRVLAALAANSVVRDLIFRLPLRKWTAYVAGDDALSVVTAHVEVIGSDGRRHGRSVEARGIYPATGQVMVATIEAMARRANRPVGVRAASEMFADFAEVTELTDVREVLPD